MLRTVLTKEQEALLTEERRWLADLQVALARFDVTPDDQATLERSVRALDELFLLVVVGEFNAGKSALINALLGQRLLEEGVTPTTTRIHLVKHGPVTEHAWTAPPWKPRRHRWRCCARSTSSTRPAPMPSTANMR